MDNYTKEQIKSARKADLYAYLLSKHSSLFKKEGDSLRLKNNHSISIKRGYSGYKDFETEETGNSVEFLVNYLGYDFVRAVLALCGNNSSIIEKIIPEKEFNDKLPPSFPEPSHNGFKNLFAYLCNRGIPKDIIQSLIDRKLLYQTKEKNNIVFINYERDWGEVRGTYTFGTEKYKGIVKNSRKDGFWWFRTSKDASVAYICESAIDAISLYLLHCDEKDPVDAYYISIGGAGKQSAIDRIKINIRAIIAVDNDEAGSECRKRNVELDCLIPDLKDWNEELVARNN